MKIPVALGKDSYDITLERGVLKREKSFDSYRQRDS